MLKDAGISKQDQQKNPQAILDVIDFMKRAESQDNVDHAFSKFNNVYAKQLNPDLMLEGDSEGTQDRSQSPSIPKRPISPAKPPRKPSTAGSRPPVPARPAHTLSVYSTDIKPLSTDKCNLQ